MTDTLESLLIEFQSLLARLEALAAVAPPYPYAWNLDKWVLDHDGKFINFDNAYPNQCMDLYRQYVADVILAPQSPLVPGAANVWDHYDPSLWERVPNTPQGVPQKGDVMIWGAAVGGGAGHIAVVLEADINRFTSFDQNWPVSSPCHKQLHDYAHTLGWLHYIGPVG